MAQRPRSARNATLRALDRMSLLAPAYRAYERVRSLRGSEDGEVDAGGLPMPPPRLRVEVAGTPGLEWFLESGRQQAEIIRAAAERHEAPLETVGSLLDFGCGCGRVLRHWAGLEGPEVFGSDYNEGLAAWSRRTSRTSRRRSTSWNRRFATTTGSSGSCTRSRSSHTCRTTSSGPGSTS